MTNRRKSGFGSWQIQGTPRITAQDIQFANGDECLSGTVYLPVEGGKVSGLIVLHGAEAPKRNQKLYQHLYEGLPGMGIAVLTFDRRGSGKSSGSLRGVDFETLADDAIAGQHALQNLSRVNPDKIGFWGLSQGGWLAVLAASRSKSAAFAVSVSAPLVTPAQQMAFATSNLLEIRGYSRGDIQEMLNARKVWLGYLRGTNSRTVAMDTLRKVETKPWFELAFLPDAASLNARSQERDSLRRVMDYDPIIAIRDVSVPLLFIYGSADPWIPVAQSVKRLQVIMKRQPNVRYAVIANANHEMMLPDNEMMAFDEKTLCESAPQASGYFMLLASWLGSTLAQTIS